MKGKTRRRRKIRLVYQRTSPLTKLSIAVVIVLSMVALLSLKSAKSAMAQRMDELSAQTAAVRQKNDQLRQDIAILGSPESVAQIAQSQLDMVQPGTVFFQPVN